MNLPNELVEKIYEYDGRHKINYNKVLNEIETRINWFIFMKDTLISSMSPYTSLTAVYLSELKEIEEKSFYDYYIRKITENMNHICRPFLIEAYQLYM